MIILDGSTVALTSVLGEVITTSNPEFVCTFAEVDSAALEEITEASSQSGAYNGTTPVDLVSAPAGTDERDVKYISINNLDTVSHGFSILRGTRTAFQFTLDTGGSATYSSEHGWIIYDGSGRATSATVPTLHAATHENGGSDEINVVGLSGLLADEQDPLNHATDHQNAGGDEISVAGLSGLLADDQNPVNHVADHANGGGDELNVGSLSGQLADDQFPVQATAILKGGSELATQAEVDAGLDTARIVTPETLAATTLEMNPEAHSGDHENGGGDEISVLGLSGLLADDQNPVNHATDHQNAGGDEISVAGLSGLLADDQNPTAHASDHVRAGSDEIDGDTLDIDFTPTNYAPDTTPGEVTNVDELTAHLSGIDVQLGAAAAGGDVVFADAENADTAINSVTPVTIFSKSLVGIAAGDTIEVEANFTILNNSTATRVYTLDMSVGTITATLVLATIAAAATDQTPHWMKARFSVLSAASVNFQYRNEYDTTPLADGASGADASSRNVWGASATDITGTNTVLFEVTSADATATQTLTMSSYTIRLIKQAT